MSARRLVIAVLALLVALIAAYSLYWVRAAGQVRNEAEAWAAQRRAAGWTVEWQEMRDVGFPTRLGLDIARPQVVTPAGLHWSADTLSLWTNPLWPGILHLSTAGRQNLDWNGRDLGAEVQGLTARLAHGAIDAHLRGWRHASGLEWADLALSLAALPPRPDPSGHPASWRFAVSVRDVGLPAPLVPGFPQNLDLVEMSGRVMGAIPDAAPTAAIAGWSRQGGIVELDRVALDWPPLGLEGEGTAALDPQGQPLLALSTRIRGFDALMDQLGRSGQVDPATGRTLKTILGLMSKPDSRGRPAIPAPISVQDGQLYLGPARLAPVPGIPWADFAGR